ncbi:MAG: hypothetical protein WCO92_06705, partial [Verrucomicrobiota bacterium]
ALPHQPSRLPRHNQYEISGLERMESAARTVAQLGKYKGDVLQYGARAREEGSEDRAAQGEEVSTNLEEAMRQFHALAQASKTGNKQDAEQLYQKTLSAKWHALSNFGLVLQTSCNEQASQAFAQGTPESSNRAYQLNLRH